MARSRLLTRILSLRPFRKMDRISRLGITALAGLSAPVIGSYTAHWHPLLDLLGFLLLPTIMACWALMAIFSLLAIKANPQIDRLIIAFAAFLLLGFGNQHILQLSNTRPQMRTDISVYQHNVWVRNPTPTALEQAIAALDRDLVVLLEAPIDGFKFDVLSDHYSHQFLEPEGRSRSARIRLYSKLPVTPLDVARADTGFAYMIAEIAAPDGDFTLVAVHLTRPWPFKTMYEQDQQLSELIVMLDQITGPVVVMGDFNSPPWGRLSRRMNTQGFDGIKSGLAGTWPSQLPRRLGVPIDLVFSRNGAKVHNWEIAKAGRSDHRATEYQISLPSPE